MAEKIKPTPTLYGKDANEFVKKMFEPPSKEEIEYNKKVLERFKEHNPLKDFFWTYTNPYT